MSRPRHVQILDTERGVDVSVSLDPAAEIESLDSLWIGTRVTDANHMFIRVNPDVSEDLGIAQFTVNNDSVLISPNGKQCNVDIRMSHVPPAGEAVDLWSEILACEIDWFTITTAEAEGYLRGLFEGTPVEVQARRAANYRVLSHQEMWKHREVALDPKAGLWLVKDGDDVVGISPDQWTCGHPWRRGRFRDVMAMASDIRAENQGDNA